MDTIVWTNEKRRLSQLVGWTRNPRQIRRAEAKRLSESKREFGQPETFAIGPDNALYNGHQRLQTWFRDFGDIEVDVRVSSRPLTEAEREKLVVFLHAGAVGAWDWDALSGWDAGALQEWGFDAETLAGWRTDVGALDAMLTADDWESAVGGLSDEDRAPFQQMTFTLRDEQAETVKQALTAARALGVFVDTGNENGNGNALARICETFITEHGR